MRALSFYKEIATPHFNAWERMPMKEVGVLMAILFNYYVARLHCDGKPLADALPHEKAEIKRTSRLIKESQL